MVIDGPHEHDHAPIPYRHGGRETVAACRRCHKLKDYSQFLDWPPSSQQAAADGMDGNMSMWFVILFMGAVKDESIELDAIGRDMALDLINGCTTTEARIFIAWAVGQTLDEVARREAEAA